MPTLSRRQTPEQHELTRRRVLLSARRAALATREQSLAAFRAQLHSFEARYIRQVGVLYRQLDEWERKIAELNSPLLLPEDLEQTGAQPAQDGEEAFEEDPQPISPVDLKFLFRELAKRIHPDFASDAYDAQLRTLLMAQANDAYKRQDTAMLQRMLNGRDAAGLPEDTAAELALVLEQLEAVDKNLTEVAQEIAELGDSELAKLQDRTLRAAEKGGDLLAEMAARVKGTIGLAMRRYELDLVRKQRNEPAFDPTPFVSADTSPAQPSKPHSY